MIRTLRFSFSVLIYNFFWEISSKDIFGEISVGKNVNFVFKICGKNLCHILISFGYTLIQRNLLNCQPIWYTVISMMDLHSWIFLNLWIMPVTYWGQLKSASIFFFLKGIWNIFENTFYLLSSNFEKFCDGHPYYLYSKSHNKIFSYLLEKT